MKIDRWKAVESSQIAAQQSVIKWSQAFNNMNSIKSMEVNLYLSNSATQYRVIKEAMRLYAHARSGRVRMTNHNNDPPTDCSLRSLKPSGKPGTALFFDAKYLGNFSSPFTCMLVSQASRALAAAAQPSVSASGARSSTDPAPQPSSAPRQPSSAPSQAKDPAPKASIFAPKPGPKLAIGAPRGPPAGPPAYKFKAAPKMAKHPKAQQRSKAPEVK
eukprot:4856884-Amphidinium_carterae.2